MVATVGASVAGGAVLGAGVEADGSSMGACGVLMVVSFVGLGAAAACRLAGFVGLGFGSVLLGLGVGSAVALLGAAAAAAGAVTLPDALGVSVATGAASPT